MCYFLHSANTASANITWQNEQIHKDSVFDSNFEFISLLQLHLQLGCMDYKGAEETGNPPARGWLNRGSIKISEEGQGCEPADGRVVQYQSINGDRLAHPLSCNGTLQRFIAQ